MDAPTVLRPEMAASATRDTSLLRWVWRTYVRNALVPLLVVEVLLVNAIIGIPAGQRYMRDGLVAAMGVHFWADVAFHVVWGALT